MCNFIERKLLEIVVQKVFYVLEMRRNITEDLYCQIKLKLTYIISQKQNQIFVSILIL